MHKILYASGFLFHPHSEQILLQQRSSHAEANSPWDLFTKSYEAPHSPEEEFIKVVYKDTGITIENASHIYSYVNGQKHCYSVWYAVVDVMREFKPTQETIFRWFSYKEITKLNATVQTKHDIVIGQRVIGATMRTGLSA